MRGGENDEARIEADYALDAQTLDLAISTDAMKVQSLRAQVALAAVPWLEQITAGQWSGELHYHRGRPRRAWSGRLALTDATIAIPGLADPVQLNSAHAQIDGARVVLDRIDAQAGKLAFTGDYRYEPGVARPHRLHLRAESWDAADLEAELMPTLRRSTNLIARALGRPMVTDWLRAAQSRWHGADRRSSARRRAPGKLPRAPAVGRGARAVGRHPGEARSRRPHRQAGRQSARLAAELQADGEGQRD